ncbi:MAG: hypothetical protein AAGJ08_20365 [Cyanobacteria bacterium P01_H01_bin.35]
MKNWNKIGQYIAKGASAALLASTTSLLASSEASAANLVKDDNGAVSRIENLEVQTAGATAFFDVDFIFDTAENIYGQSLNFDFLDPIEAEAAAGSIISALGEDNWLGLSVLGDLSDEFLVPFFSRGDSVGGRGDEFGALSADLEGEGRAFIWLENMYAKFSAAAAGGGEENKATTPEPSLIFGFITLGGLMLGSKINHKG